MSPHPSDRYPSARALVEAIDGWLGRRRRPSPSIVLNMISVVLCVATLLAAVVLRPGIKGESPASSRAPNGGSPDEPADRVAAPAVPPATTQPLTSGQLVTSSKGKQYHIVPCRHAEIIEPLNRILLGSAEEARSMGRQPCKTCRPPVAMPEVPQPVGKGA